jgi:hypothetical protein
MTRSKVTPVRRQGLHRRSPAAKILQARPSKISRQIGSVQIFFDSDRKRVTKEGTIGGAAIVQSS